MKIYIKKIFQIVLLQLLFTTFITNGFAQYKIQGNTYYSDNSAPVTGDKAYILYYDNQIMQAVYLDSANLDENGRFCLFTYYNDSVLVCIGNQQRYLNEDYVQTYYPSTIDWTQALQVYPPDSPVNINIAVQRIIPADDSYSFSGKIVTLDINNNLCPLEGAIVVAQQDTAFISSTVTDVNGNYTLDSLNLGSAIIYATKIGYCLDSSGIIVGGNSINHSIMQLRKVRVRGLISNNKIINKFTLSQNYPNPFNPTANIKFRINQSGFVSLKIYDILGRQVSILINSFLNPGNYEIEWNASEYSSGIYFYELVCGNQKIVNKMLLIK